MYTALIVLHGITCLLLITVVLLQSSRGAGLSSVFTSDGGNSLMGAGTGAFLKKVTSALAVVFMLTACSLAFFSVKRQKSVMASRPSVASPEQAARSAAMQEQILKKLKEAAAAKQNAVAGAQATKQAAQASQPASAPAATNAAAPLPPTVDDVMKEQDVLNKAVPAAAPAASQEPAPAALPEAKK